MKNRHIVKRDGIDQDGDPIYRCIHCGGWSGGREGLLSTKCYAARKIRIGDEVTRLGKPDRVGKVWELRASGFASVHWDDERPSIHASDPASYNVKHYKLENLRHARWTLRHLRNAPRSGTTATRYSKCGVHPGCKP